MKPSVKEEARRHLEAYLRQKGLETHKNFSCLNPAHEDTHPSMRFSPLRHSVHCFACGAHYDIFDLVGMEYNLTDFPQKLRKTCELFGLESPFPLKEKSKEPQEIPPSQEEAVTAYLKAAHARIDKTDYPQRRGLSPDIIDRFHLGYDPAFRKGTGGKPWKALIIPTGPHTYTARNTDRTADKQSRIRKYGASPLFNAEALAGADVPVFVVEGEIDALSVMEAGGEAVALGSVANAGRFAQYASQVRPAHPLLLALDNDPQGMRAQETLCEALTQAGIPFRPVSIAGAYKDPNEALLASREDFVSAVQSAAAQAPQPEATERDAYLDTSVANFLHAFIRGNADGIDTPCILTGFPKLNEALDGGLYEGLYIVGAISSLGKTSLLLQVADQIAASNRDVIIFSLEMARTELMAKSISRYSLMLSLAAGHGPRDAKTARDITTQARYATYTDAEQALLDEAVYAYGLYAHKLYIHEGVGDIGAQQIRSEVERHIRLTGERPVVMLDYLQILSPHNGRGTDKQNMDKAVLELKRISRDHKLTVIAISSLNRAGYREAVTMEAFKESGAIEYSSDVLIGLQFKGAGRSGFDAAAEKEKNPREIELVVLKNRNGPIGAVVPFVYYPAFHYFQEM